MLRQTQKNENNSPKHSQIITINTISVLHQVEIEIIAGDLNCIDFNDINEDNQSPDELASFIESIRITNSLVDTNFEKSHTFMRKINDPTTGNINTIKRRLDRIYISNKLINYNNHIFKNITPPTIDSTPLSDHNFLSTTYSISLQRQNNTNKRWRLKRASILSYQMIYKIDQILESLNIEFKNEPNSFKFKHLIKTIDKIKLLFVEFQKQNDYNSKILINNLKDLLSTDMRDQAFSSLSTDFQIDAIKNKDGLSITDQKGIEQEFYNFYSNLYDQKIDCPQTHYQMLKNWNIHKDNTWSELNKKFTADEIINVINQLNPNKSPGSDGIINQFYITHKLKLAPLLASAFNETLNDPEVINKSFKDGLIITIPKKGDPELIKNRRPITLANCIYKIHSKAINNRLLKILPKIINNNQKGFVPGRFILENIATTNEIIKYCNNSKLDGIITFYDFEKAFDSISHESIQRTLLHIQIPINLINLIMKLLKDSNAKIEINNEITKPFTIRRGVKQGDPLSPTLFVLVIEVLAKSIMEDQNIIGLPLNNGTQREKFQGFADDSSSMVSNSQQQNLVLNHFDNFCNSTSSKLNIEKSISIILGSPDTSDLKIPISKNPERYLGYYFTNKGIHRKLPEILRSIRSSLILWKTSGTTIKTKTNILKAFTLSKLTYFSYLEKYSKEEIKQLNKIVEWFLSASNYKNSTGFNVINLMSTKRAQYPMNEGGWNIWDINKRQRAQRLWMINQLMFDIESGEVKSATHRSWEYQVKIKNITSQFLIENLSEWDRIRKLSNNFEILKAIKNSNNKPLTLSEWYDKINTNDPQIPKTEFQKDLFLRGYSYNQLFLNILKIRDPKTRNTMFRFQSRCLPLNYLHEKLCPM
ncbi:hypothetical protein ACTFIW_007629 [Dictyostelium discoideum]